MIANIFHTKGIMEKHEISHILKQIKVLENLQQQINSAIDVKSNLVYQTAQLQDKENNLKKILKAVLAGFNIFIKIKDESKWKAQRWKKHLNNSRNYLMTFITWKLIKS